MGLPQKRSTDLTEAEIDCFKRNEAEHWMHRVMTRLYKLLKKGDEYDKLAAMLVKKSATLAGVKDFLKQAVERIKALLQKAVLTA